MTTKTWPYGATRKAIVIAVSKHLTVFEDDQGEGHILVGGACPDGLEDKQTGTLTFTEGGPTGGYWKFTRDK